MTVQNLDKSIDFYTRILNMELISIKSMKALKFGPQRINLHVAGLERKPNAHKACVGSLDLCFIVDTPITTIIKNLTNQNITIEFGPVTVIGAQGEMESIFIRDPDKNLVELSFYEEQNSY